MCVYSWIHAYIHELVYSFTNINEVSILSVISKIDDNFSSVFSLALIYATHPFLRCNWFAPCY